MGNDFKVVYLPQTDEFNYISSINFYGDKEENSAVVCISGMEILYNNFDKIIQYTPKKNDTLLSPNITDKNIIWDEMKLLGLRYSNNVVPYSDLNITKHVYSFTFSSLASEMLNSGVEIIKPRERDYLLIKDKLKGINKRIVTINGRNLNRNEHRNNLLTDVIVFLLKNDCYVINCTMSQPNLDLGDSYIEIGMDELSDYSVNISYFLNSNLTISVADSGGITNHICTKANMVLYGCGGWVDSPTFGVDGMSLFDISKTIKPTFKTIDLAEILNIVNTSEKPSNISFFDENKILK